MLLMYLPLLFTIPGVNGKFSGIYFHKVLIVMLNFFSFLMIPASYFFFLFTSMYLYFEIVSLFVHKNLHFVVANVYGHAKSVRGPHMGWVKIIIYTLLWFILTHSSYDIYCHRSLSLSSCEVDKMGSLRISCNRSLLKSIVTAVLMSTFHLCNVFGFLVPVPLTCQIRLKGFCP